MSLYKTGIVYQIYYNNDPNIHYIGSSLNNIDKCWEHHRQDYNKYINSEKKPASTIYPYFKDLGINNFTIVELKKCRVTDTKHLKMYEQLYINKLKPVNRINILSGVDTKNRHAKYRTDNKEKISEYGKKRYANNKEYFENYTNENKEKIKEYKAQHYQKNKEKLEEKAKEIVLCKVCNVEIRKVGYIRHTKSKTHIKNLEN